jgi:hypothetical protein
MFALMSWLRRQWAVAVRATVAALATTLVWLTLQTVLMTLYNYSYGGNPSANLLGGGFFGVWVAALGRPRAVAYLFLAFGPLFVLLAAGFRHASPTLRLLAWSAILPAIAFAYVQQPDRALWNFHFVVIPIAMLVLEALPDRACWAFVASFAIANVRLGEHQSPVVLWLRVAMLGVSTAIAIRAIRAAGRQTRFSPSPTIEARHE